ncbi:MAG TPA: c-type cytochrome [Ignavibacteria bacterium]|nr:c-type cytochrome [Ignavibacteria bacterium]
MKTFITPARKVLLLIILFFCSIYLIVNDSNPLIGCKSDQPVVKKDSIVAWKFPDPGSIKEDEEGKIIREGRRIFLETYKYIGPDVKDTAKRYLGNNMDCQNCHLRGGTLKNVFGLVGVYSDYPALDVRTNKVISIQERINQCMTRSMNGKSLPEKSNEMNSLVAYLKWLSTYVPKGTRTEGNGVPRIDLIKRAADPVNGKTIFARNCMTCHAENGFGVLNDPGNVVVAADSLNGYDFPPLFGPDSYNDGAGMYRQLTATAFIYSKMPYNDAVLSLEDSYDVAAYINSQPRPHKSNVESDYPDLKLKPLDSPFPPYDDNFSQSQHKYGPYQEMLKEGEKDKFINPNTGR